MTYWSSSGDAYGTRAANLLAGYAVPLLDSTTVTGNGGGNVMQANGGLNLWYGNRAQDTYPDFNADTELFINV
jgi:hypothetical protein